MKHIISFIGTAFFLVVIFVAFLPPLVSSYARVNADTLKSGYVSEIENSDFNSSVINSCISDAQSKGYQLSVDTLSYDENNNINIAKVLLTYKLSIPIYSISEDKTVQGIAR